MMDCINCVIFVGAIILAVFWYVRRKFSYWADRNVPFFEPSFPYGNMSGIGKTKAIFEITQEYYNKIKVTGEKFLGLYIFINPALMAVDLDFVKMVLVKNFTNFHDRGAYLNEKDEPLAAHLLVLEGQRWKNLRAKLTPTFTSGKMKYMFPTIVKIGEEFKNTMELSIKKSSEIEIKDILARFTTDVIGTCAFGLECNSLKDPDAEFRSNGRKMLNSINQLKQLFTLLFKNVALKLHITLLPKDVSKFFLSAVEDTVAYREKNNVKRNDFMDLLIELKNNGEDGDKLNVVEVAAQALLFFFAGFETSSTAMSFALYELAQNQKVQNKARECVQTVLKKHNGEFTYEAMMEMTYVTQCINESLRKYPPVSNLFRSVTEDFKIPDSNVVLAKGTSVMIPVYGIHHDPAYYENPEVYDPERFTPENEAKRNPYAFLAFGEGPRNCIGLRFGLMQARIGLATLLNNFHFELSDKTSVPLKLSIKSPILSTDDGIWVRVQKI